MPAIDLRTHIDGVDDLLHRLNRVVATDTRAGPMQRLKERLLERLTTYPPPPPGSSYERTQTLGNSWRVTVDAIGSNQYADQVSLELHNDASGPTGQYAAWVQGDPSHDGPSQAEIHRGRWVTDEQAIRLETGPFLDDLSNSIRTAFGSA